MNKCFGILADDLTGSMDTGLQLFNEGYRVKVTSAVNAVQEMSGDTEILVVNSESRNIPQEQAYAKVVRCVRAIQNAGAELVYKKVDSTLRGNIGKELEAVLAETQADHIIFAPALPFQHRTTINGLHIVNGVRLQDTELAYDPFSPTFTSDIAEIIHMQSLIPSGNLLIDTIRDNFQTSMGSLDCMYRSGAKVVVCDAIDDGDIICIVKAVKACKRKVIYCGSAGLIRYIGFPPRVERANEAGRECRRNGKRKKPALVLSGSPACMSKQQIQYLAENDASVLCLQMNHSVLDMEERAQSAEKERLFIALTQAALEKRDAVLDAAAISKHYLFGMRDSNAEKLRRHSRFVQNLLSEVAREFAGLFEGGLVIFGGDTVKTVSDALGATGFEICGQAEPLIPVCRLLGTEKYDDIPVVTKAGGFGTQQSLMNILSRI